jgi:hypothetical protein
VSTLLDSYASSNTNADQWMTGYTFGQTFTTPSGTAYNLVSCKFWMYRDGTGTGENMRAKLFAHSGTWGSSGVPSGSALATSSNVSKTSVGTSYGWVTFTFATPYALTASTHYCIVCEIDSGADIIMGEDTSSPSHGGNQVFYDGTWDSWSNDTIFEVYGDVGTISVDVTNSANVSAVTAQVPTISSQVKLTPPVVDTVNVVVQVPTIKIVIGRTVDNAAGVTCQAEVPTISSQVKLTVSNSANVSDVTAQVPTLKSNVNLSVSNSANVSNVDTPIPSLSSQVKLTVSNSANVSDVTVQVPTLKSDANLAVSNAANVDVDTPIPSLSSQVKLIVVNTANTLEGVVIPVITRFINKAHTPDVVEIERFVNYNKNLETDLDYDRALICPSCGSTNNTRVLHNTSYNWICENSHTWLDQGPMTIRIKKIKW